MHTIQYIATQADDVDHAFRSVKDYLETQLGNDPESPTNSWFDWFVAGGGRWATGDENQYNDSWQGDVVAQDSPKFQEYLDKAVQFRKNTLDEYLADIRKLDLQQTLDSIEISGGDDFRAGMYLYPFSQLYNITMGVWNYNSYYYDIMSDSANMIHLKNSLDNGGKNWYLVPVDFHY